VDALILSAFAMLGFAAAIAIDGQFLKRLWAYSTHMSSWPGRPEWLRDLEFPCKRVHEDFRAFLAVASLGIALATFRRGWRFRRGLPSPGMAASACAGSIVLFHLGRAAVLIGSRDLLDQPAYWLQVGGFPARADRSWTPFSDVTGAIAGVWSYLLLARQWRPRPGWRDALGRWLGWLWLGDVAIRAAFVALWR
jgi:hypothetical protein